MTRKISAFKLIVISLLSIALVCILGSLLLLYRGLGVPGEIMGIAGVAVGALAGVLRSDASKDEPPENASDGYVDPNGEYDPNIS